MGAPWVEWLAPPAIAALLDVSVPAAVRLVVHAAASCSNRVQDADGDPALVLTPP